MPIRRKILISAFVMLLMPLVIVVSYFYVNLTHFSESSASTFLSEKGASTINRLDRVLNLHVDLAQTISFHINQRHSLGNLQSQREELEAFILQNSVYRRSSLRGVKLISKGKTRFEIGSRSEKYLPVFELSSTPAKVSLLKQLNTDEFQIEVETKLLWGDNNGKIISYFEASDFIFSASNLSGMGPSGRILIYAKKDSVLISVNEREIDVSIISLTQAPSPLASPKKGFFPSISDDAFLYQTVASSDFDFKVTTMKRLDEINSLPNFSINSFLFILAVIIFLLVWILMRITQPFFRLHEALEKLVQGKAHEVEIQSALGEEMADIYRSIYDLLNSLKRKNSELTEGNALLQSKTTEVEEKERIILNIVEDLDLEKIKYEEKSSLLESVISNLHEGVIYANYEGKLQLFNSAAKRILGLGVSEVDSSQWSDHYGLYEEDQVTKFREKDLPLVRALAGEAISGITMFCKNPDISYGKYISVSAEAVVDGKGNRVGAIASFRDVTQERAEDKRFRMVLDASSSGMLLINDGGKVVIANSAAQKIFGYEKSEMESLSIGDLVPSNLRDTHDEYRKAFMKENKARGMGIGTDLFGCCKDGSLVPVEIGLTPLETSEGKFVVASIVDVTERKEYISSIETTNAELRRSNEDLNDFAYIASHDLRSPLRAIDHLANWVLDDSKNTLSDQSLDDLGTLRSRVARMDNLLEGLLRYSRIGRDKSEVEEIQLSNFIREESSILDRPAAFIIHVANDMPTVQVETAPLRQVLLNLIGNAIKHRSSENGRVSITCTEFESLFQISVSDDGEGIPKDQYENIFGLFKTLKPKDEVETSGMGLAVVKKTVLRMGGQIEVCPNSSRGVTFRFTWPKQPLVLA